MEKNIILDDSHPGIQHLCKKDKRLAKVIDMVGPISYSCHSENVYSFLVHEIIEQMLSVSAGQRIYDRFKALCGGIVEPSRVSKLSIEEIRETGISQSKAKCIVAVTSAVLNGVLDFESLYSRTDEEIEKTLTSIYCIGPWTAKMFLIFVLDRQDILPFEDGAFLQTYRWVYKTDDCRKLAIIQKCKKWKPYSSLATRYFYRALDSGLTKTEFHLFK